MRSLTVIDYRDSDEASVRLAYARRKALHQQIGGSHLLDWLSVEERQRYNALGSREYADAWLCGRVVAKELFASVEANETSIPQRLTIDSRNAQNKGRAPSIWYAGQELPGSLSISHTEESVLVALTREPRIRVGVDLIQLGAVKKSVREMWFTPDERSIANKSAVAPAQIWAAKEATYKALNVGEPFYPLRIVVERCGESFCSCRYRTEAGVQRLTVKTWETEDGDLAAFAATTG